MGKCLQNTVSKKKKARMYYVQNYSTQIYANIGIIDYE